MRKLKSISQQKCFADCFTDWHNILNEDVHVSLCLEQEHAGYYGVNSTLDGNPSDIAGNHLGKLFTTILLLDCVL